MCTSNCCTLCPRNCGVDRNKKTGACGAGSSIRVAKAFLHKWEEPCISGVNGSGTVFFSGCSLKCVFCQNHSISQEYFGRDISVDGLRGIFHSLREKGAHNINLVSPSHYIREIKEALEGMVDIGIPVVYNSNGYENVDSLKLLEGHIQVYLPDLKYVNDQLALRYSGVSDYLEKASKALKEMYRQTGPLEFDGSGLLKRGLVIRHLIMPGYYRESLRVLDWIRGNLPEDIAVSLMSQYVPIYKASLYPEIDRPIARYEYERVVNHFLKLGFKEGYYQERESSSLAYVPDFDLEGTGE